MISVTVQYFHTDKDVATEVDRQFCLWHGLHYASTPWPDIHQYANIISMWVRVLDA